MHINSIGFRGLRKLGLNHDLHNSDFKIADIEQLQASAINVVVGPNGGGKSTIMDLIRAMSDANVLSTIARENITTATSSGFVVRFDNDAQVIAMFNKMGIEEFGLAIVSSSAAGQKKFHGRLAKDASIPVPGQLRETINHLSAEVGYRCRHDEVGIPTQAFIDVLNADAKYLSGLAPFPLADGQDAYKAPPGFCSRHDQKSPIHLIANDVVSVSFNDDERQHNHVPIAMFPSGWRAFGGLVAWLATQSKGSICVIEEPETHIHPKLLRVLMRRICETVKLRDLQVFMTTHSSTLIDIHTWPEGNVKLFEAAGYQIKELTNPSLALASLGVRPSDVCQANGVVWVEGSSDRLYISHWLKLWCAQNGKKMPIENNHFGFVFYGGSMLNQFAAGPTTDLIEIFRINANSIVVMDRDLDFIVDVAGRDVPQNPSGTKARIRDEINATASSGQYCWITQRYTIESYLPSGFRDKYYELEDGRLRAKTTVSKVEVAEKFRSQFNDFTQSHEQSSDLPKWIRRLYDSIEAWNA